MTPEEQRLEESHQRTKHWKRWGPYLAERQWGPVREDYSPTGCAWEYLPHEHARGRGPIAGAKTASAGFATGISGCVLRWRFGMGTITS